MHQICVVNTLSVEYTPRYRGGYFKIMLVYGVRVPIPTTYDKNDNVLVIIVFCVINIVSYMWLI